MKKRIFVASEYFFPDIHYSTGYFLTGIVEGIDKDFETIVFSEIKDKAKEKKVFYKNIEINRIEGIFLDKDNLLKRILNFTYLSFIFFFKILFRIRKDDILLVVTNPAPLIVISGFIKILKSCKVIILVHDVFPENLDSVGLLRKSNFFYKILLRIFNWGYKKSNKIIVCGRDMKKLFHNKLKNYKGLIEFIPNWGDSQKIRPDEFVRNSTLSQYGLNNDFVFQFAGNLGRAQGLENLIDAIKKCNRQNVKFLFFGNGYHKNKIEKESILSNNILYGGIFSREQAHKYINACDVAIVSLSENMLGLGVPSKTYDILAAGKPILFIGDQDSEIAQVITDNNLGFVCANYSVCSLIEGIDFFMNLNDINFKLMGKRCRDVLEKKYSEIHIINQYRKSINKLYIN